MELRKMILSKYKRLYVTGIKYFEYTPEKPFNIILGRNGSGKSSILKEIFPNVEDDKSEYDKGGYKILEYKHRSNIYVVSYTRDNNRYSFKINGEEFNQQGIKKTQKILIEEHFGLTKPIYELLLSISNFTTMSVNERKNWFTNILTTIDYREALELYNKTKLRIKELNSFIKLIQSKLFKVDDVLTNFSDERINRLKQDKLLFDNMLNTIISNRVTTVNTTMPDTDKMDRVYKVANKGYEYFVDRYGKKGLKKLEIDKVTLKAYIDQIEEQLNNIDNKLLELDDNKMDISVDVNDLKKEVSSIKASIKKLVANDVGITKVKVFLETSKKYNNYYMDLVTIADDLKEYENINIDTAISKKIHILSRHLDKLTELSKEINNDYIKQWSFKQNEEVKCPVCSAKFKPGYNSELYNELLKKKNRIENKLNDIKQRYEELSEYYTKVQVKQDLIHKLEGLFYLIGEDVASYVKKDTNNFTNFNNIYNTLSYLNFLFSNDSEVEVLVNKLNDLNEKITLYSKLDIGKRKELTKQKEKLIKERSDTISKLIEFKEKLNIVDKDLNLLDKYKQAIKILEHKLNKFYKHKKNVYLEKYNEYLTKVMVLIKKEILNIDEILVEYDSAKKMRDNLQKELNEYKERLVIAKNIENDLSPTKGIIGETMNNTINFVLKRINELVNNIWSYDIEILPCDFEENNLTFRFPVKIGGIKEIPDVSKGSSSIKEIIDLAFKITAMEFLDILDYPLILDEFGRTMDPGHRVKAYDFVDNISKVLVNQVFMVSHFESMYARFKNTDVIVLDNEGINYTGTYNKVVVIK